MKIFGPVVVPAAFAYLLVLGVAMQRASYDQWGALVICPILVALSAPLIKWSLSGTLRWLRPYAWLGLGAKLAGALVSDRVRLDVYSGQSDSIRYHNAGKLVAAAVRDGLQSPLELFSAGRGTASMEQLTGLVYTFAGSSRLAGALIFSWMSYWGLVFYLKAAIVAVPGLASRRYALALFLSPTLVYWGSSVGKEAVVGLFLGMTAYGVSILFARDERWPAGLAFAVVGVLGAARIRPHFAAVWVGAAVIALLGRSIIELARPGSSERRRGGVLTLLLFSMATIGFVVLAGTTLAYLTPAGQAGGDEIGASDQLGLVFENTELRTSQGGSAFTPIDISNPLVWPYAAARTLTRPVIVEARGLAGLLSALEMTALVVVGAVSWRRLLHAPKLALVTPYLVFGGICVFAMGVAFASIGNLGILVRQRSLVFPLLFVFLCLPPLPRSERRRRRPPARTARPDAPVASAFGARTPTLR